MSGWHPTHSHADIHQRSAHHSGENDNEDDVPDPNAVGIFGRWTSEPDQVEQVGELGKDTETEGDAADTSYGSSSASKYAASPERSNTHIQQRDSRESAEAQPKDPLVRPSAAGPDRRYTHRTPGEGLIHPVFEEGAGANAHESARQKTSMFDLVHSKGNLHKAHIAQHGANMPVKLSHLFKRPLVRQWLYDGKLYREKDEREPSRFELFFDLMFVGIVHQLAEGASEAATGMNVLKFVLVFYPSWSVWTDVRTYINQSGTDDVWQRLYILGIMILLAGYSANATGIIIEHEAPEAAAEATGGQATGGEATGGESTPAAVAERAIRLIPRLLARAAAESSESVGEPVRSLGGGYFFIEGYHKAIAAAIGFYLVAKFCRLALYFIYGMLLPKFRKAQFINGIALVVISAIYIPLIFVTSPVAIVVLVVVGIVTELASRYVLGAAMQWAHGRGKHAGEKMFIPALSIEHLMERMAAFTILIVGESILNATYQASGNQYGPRSEYGRSALAIVIPFFIMWLYFDADGSRTFVHALRRHWFPSITYTHIHFPLCAALILMSAALAKLVTAAGVGSEAGEISPGFLWFFGGSISVVMLCIAILGMLHKNLDVHGSSFIDRRARIVMRLTAAAIFALLPIKQDWRSLHYLGIHAAVLAWVVGFETFGKLGAVGRRYDSERAAALKKAFVGQGQDIAMGDLETGRHSRSSASRGAEKRMSDSAQNVLSFGRRKLNKGWDRGVPRRASWHEHSDLTPAERGEEDVGIESELGNLEEKELSTGQRWALAH